MRHFLQAAADADKVLIHAKAFAQASWKRKGQNTKHCIVLTFGGTIDGKELTKNVEHRGGIPLKMRAWVV